ncbi:beta-xylosidase [Granulicella sp. 5B5]|uniref:GH39 family glycosyl hydrolase n=1 Tax=Granulicella sp. 5B5 TaxID=1617967 RepID=UPI0015F49819|nr:beta-xylosidase [Granulicella sp. 5B5]QMV18899.1 beta-xylosidase [Granulicella sp. 5B5]
MALLPRLAALALATVATLAPAQQPATIHVDLAHSLGPWKPITNFYGYDELNYTTAPNGRKLLAELAHTSPLPVYIRAHHLLTSGDGKPALKWSSTNIYTLDAHGHPIYDFKIIDQTFDAWLAAGVRPMVELGFMPEALASGTNPYHLTYPHTIEGSVQSPPKDYAAWGELCRTLVAHLVARYGRDRVATWYFEVWNEPNIPYWHGTEAEYLKLYDYAVAGVRSALPTARVGGPATTSPRDKKAADYLAAFLNHIAHDKSAANGQPIPLDFITFHAKGSPTLIHDTPTTTHVRMGLNKELTDADHGFALIASYPQFKSLPIILSEADPEGCAACSAKENHANGYRNGPLYAAYTAAVIKGLFQLQDKYQVNLLGMLSWSFEFEGRDYFEGFRTLATNGIDKPVLNVFRMTGMLSGTRVATTSSAATPLDTILHTGVPAPEIDALATHTHSGAEVLVWNYQDDDLPDAVAAPMDVDITGLPASVHNVKLQAFTLDRTHSNSFTTWLAMGSPQHPTPAQYQQLEQSSQLKFLDAPHTLTVDHGHITIPATLPAQATTLYRLSW